MLGDDCLATDQDTYNSNIAQLMIVNPEAHLVIVAPDLGDGSREGEFNAREDQSVPMKETA